MTPEYLFDTEAVRLAFVLGIVMSAILYEWRLLTTGSIVVPGYIGIFILQPSVIVASIANAVISYWLVHCLAPRFISMSARTKFSALVVTSVTAQSLAHAFGGEGSESASMSIFIGAGYVIPALIAHDMARHGALRSLSAVLGTGLATGLCIIGLTWLAPDVAIARPAVAPIRSAFLIDSMYVAMLLSAVSVVALKSRHQLGGGGFVGPAYLSFLLVHPMQLAFLALLIPLTYLTTTRLLMPRMILFGRRKFAVMLLVGSLYSWGGMLLLEAGFGWESLPFSSASLSVVSVVLIGLIANDVERAGWSGVVKGGALAVLFTLTGTLLVQEGSHMQRVEILLPLALLTAAAGTAIFAPLVKDWLRRVFASGVVRTNRVRDLQFEPINPTNSTWTTPRFRRDSLFRAAIPVGLVSLIGIGFLPVVGEMPLFLGAGRDHPTVTDSVQIATYASSPTPYSKSIGDDTHRSDSHHLATPFSIPSPNTLFRQDGIP